MRRTLKKYIGILLRGMGMGAADVVPGVSGGTIAFITGIYEELINSLKSFNIGSLKLLLSGRLKTFWEAVNGNFLLALFLGIGISVVSLAKLIRYILEHHPVLIWSFFFGLIIASAIVVARKITRWNARVITGLITGIVVAYTITVLTPAETPETWWFIILSGALAICAMILPGISGAFILLLLGKYEFAINAVSTLNIPILALLAIGAVAGLLSFSNLLSWLLRRYHNMTIALLSGFMIGSLNKVWPWKEVVQTFVDRHGVEKPLVEKNVFPTVYEQVTGNEAMLLSALLLMLVGFFLIIVVEKLTTQKTTV